MKTPTLKQPQLCERSNVSFSRWPSLLRLAFTSLVNRGRALQAIQTGRNVLAVAVNEIFASKRYTAGVIFLLVVTPSSSIVYQLFNPAVSNNDWYYLNTYYFLYTLSPYLMLFFASIGIFLLFPVKCKTAYLATVLPAGYAVAKLIYYSFFVHSNEQFHQPAHWVIFLAGLFMAGGFLLTINYLLYRKYHLRDGTIARIIGVIRMPNVNPDDKLRILEKEAMDLVNFNQRY